jgi:hypothetical protein
MKVKELITDLDKADPDADVWLDTGNDHKRLVRLWITASSESSCEELRRLLPKVGDITLSSRRK